METESAETKYEKILEVQQVDFPSNTDRTLSFAVGENFNIFVTNKYHQHLFEKYGVDPDRTLTEGNIILNKKDGTIEEVVFKANPYQPNPGLVASPEEMKKFQEAVEKIIRSKIKTSN